MTATIPSFASIEADTPNYDDVATEYAALGAELDAATDATERKAALERWDGLLRKLDTWHSLTHLRFNQDTTNEDYKKARDFCDELSPKLTDLAVKLQRKLVAAGYRGELEAAFGAHAFALWQADIDSFDPAIEERLTQESKLCAKYVELLATAKLEIQGETVNLSGIRKFTTHADREIRHEAQRLRWGFFEENAEELDSTFDQLVELRHGMAKTLGFESFTELGYRRMKRIDYGRDDVEIFREEVRKNVVPLCLEIRARQKAKLGVDPLMFWDLPVHDPRGNPKPEGDHDHLVEQAQTMFDRMHPELSDFFRMMNEKGYLDLKTREGKAGGGFCTSFPSHGVPFIYANFNGTKGDVEVFTHEAGHAFQCWRSRNQPLLDYLWPTMESCEIHSMSLEFLTWPYMDLFFGAEEAERFRTLHLTESLLFLPYGVAVDHFQHEIYANPDATPAERHAMWKRMEEMYLPWRNPGDLGFIAMGGQWQHQRHIYQSPFYYIDYTLALTCALQFWARAAADPVAALDDYIALCDRGGEAPFRALAESAGLTSPFEAGCLAEAVGRARESLGF